MQIKLVSSDKEYGVNRVGIFSPEPKDVGELTTGEVGFIIAGIKGLRDIKIGDTITDASRPTAKSFPWFSRIKTNGFLWCLPFLSGTI